MSARPRRHRSPAPSGRTLPAPGRVLRSPGMNSPFPDGLIADNTTGILEDACSLRRTVRGIPDDRLVTGRYTLEHRGLVVHEYQHAVFVAQQFQAAFRSMFHGSFLLLLTKFPSIRTMINIVNGAVQIPTAAESRPEGTSGNGAARRSRSKFTDCIDPPGT